MSAISSLTFQSLLPNCSVNSNVNWTVMRLKILVHFRYSRCSKFFGTQGAVAQWLACWPVIQRSRFWIPAGTRKFMRYTYTDKRPSGGWQPCYPHQDTREGILRRVIGLPSMGSDDPRGLPESHSKVDTQQHSRNQTRNSQMTKLPTFSCELKGYFFN